MMESDSARPTFPLAPGPAPGRQLSSVISGPDSGLEPGSVCWQPWEQGGGRGTAGRGQRVGLQVFPRWSGFISIRA